jgi:dUTP pyrophosphatase
MLRCQKEINFTVEVLQFKRLFSDAKLPTRAYQFDAGADLYSRDAAEVKPGEGFKFSTGVACNIPEGFYAHIHTRSSMAKKGWVVVGGICDSSYKGELFVLLRNVSNEVLSVDKNDRIAQLILYPIETPLIVEVDDIGNSERQDGSFGSTGR